MSMLFSRTIIVPLWLLVFGMSMFYWSPLTAGTGVLLLVLGIMGPAIMLMLWKKSTPTVAPVLQRVDASRTEQ